MKINYSQLLIWVAWLVSNRAFNCCGCESGDGVVCGHRRWGMVWQQGWRLGAHHYGARAIHNDCALQQQHKDISKSIHPSWRHGFKYVCRPGLVELVSAMKSKTNPVIRMVQIPISVITLYCALHYHYAISSRWSCCKWWVAGSNHEQKLAPTLFKTRTLTSQHNHVQMDVEIFRHRLNRCCFHSSIQIGPSKNCTTMSPQTYLRGVGFHRKQYQQTCW